MEDKRRAPRIKEDDEVAITVVSGGENLPEKEINGSHTKDISVFRFHIKGCAPTDKNPGKSNMG